MQKRFGHICYIHLFTGMKQFAIFLKLLSVTGKYINMDFLRNVQPLYMHVVGYVQRLTSRCMRYLLFLFCISLNFDFFNGMYDSFSVTTEKTNVPTNEPLQNRSRQQEIFYFFYHTYLCLFQSGTVDCIIDHCFSVQYVFTFNFLHVQQCIKTCHLIVLSAINRLNVDRINR